MVDAVFWFAEDQGVAITMIGVFLGLDIRGMIKNTSSAGPGDYDPLKKKRYLLSVFGCIFLLVKAIASQHFRTLLMTGVYMILAPAIIAIMWMFVNSIEGNKLVTGKVPDEGS